MQKIVLFIEPIDELWFTPLKIGNLFMNRFAVGEDAASEVLKIFELEKTSGKMAYPGHPEYTYMNFEEERKQKGMDLSTKIDVYSSMCISRSKSNKKTFIPLILEYLVGHDIAKLLSFLQQLTSCS